MRLLVNGWSGRHNVGDELIKYALVLAFEKKRGIELCFVDKIDEDTLKHVNGIIFGGGGILHDDPNVTPGALCMLLSGNIPVFYVGVGLQKQKSPMHEKLISVAKLVAFREIDMPDLVYSIPFKDMHIEKKYDILFVPNIEVVPTWNEPHWKHAAWEMFKNETAQALDQLIDSGRSISFLPMCSNEVMDDVWAAQEIIARMHRRSSNKSIVNLSNVSDNPRKYFAEAVVVVTQRYHGIIISETVGTPYIAIDHHDKLKNAVPCNGQHLSYCGVTKDSLVSAVEHAETFEPYVIPTKIFDNIFDKVVTALISF